MRTSSASARLADNPARPGTHVPHILVTFLERAFGPLFSLRQASGHDPRYRDLRGRFTDTNEIDWGLGRALDVCTELANDGVELRFVDWVQVVDLTPGEHE